MLIHEYFSYHKIEWFPIKLNTEGGKKIPMRCSYGMPKSTDFLNVSAEELKKRREKLEGYQFGAVDCSQLFHIDVDFRKSKKYGSEELEFIEDCKKKYPYFLSSTKKMPHFLFFNESSTEQKKKRYASKYEDIEILSGSWSYFPLKENIINWGINPPVIDMFKEIVKENNTTKINKIEEKEEDEGFKSVEPELNSDLVENLLSLIKNDGEGLHYDDYIRIIWALKNDNPKNRKKALKFSMRSSKHNSKYFSQIWQEGREGNSLGTVHFYAREHSPEKYRKLIRADSIQPTEENLAKLFLNLFGDNTLYSKNSIFIYEKEWKKDTINFLILKKKIRNILNEFIIQKISDTKNNTEFQKHLNAIHLKIQMRRTIDNICALILQDKAEEASFNSIEFDTGEDQLYNIQFKNGLYDLKKMEFRKRNKNDYITQILDWNYCEEVKDEDYNEVKDFFRKLQPDKNQRDFTISWLASHLNGNIDKAKFKMNIGYSAENGKSTESEIHSTVFGFYTKKLSANYFTENNSKRHKETIHLINNPIRYAYIEELRQNKLDTDFLKEFCDGKLECDVLFKESTVGRIQATLNTSSNNDANFEADKGLLRRGIIQEYKSQFLKYQKEDDYQNNKFQKKEGYFRRYENEGLRNAYFKILKENYGELKIPKKNENLFESIAEEYDEMGDFLRTNFELTKNKNDFIHKSIVNDIFQGYKKYPWRKLLTEFKKRGIEYNREKMIKGKRGYFIGIKQKKIIYTDEEEED